MKESDAREILADIERAWSRVPANCFRSDGPSVIVIGIMISVFQYFVGINAALYYAPLMFSNMGCLHRHTIIVGGANVIFTVVAIVTGDGCSCCWSPGRSSWRSR